MTYMIEIKNMDQFRLIVPESCKITEQIFELYKILEKLKQESLKLRGFKV